MAVKVSGTTVIDGSRQLTNITGLDATTISTIENNISFGPFLGTTTGNATLDLSTGTFFEHTPTEDTTFVFNNPPSSGIGYNFYLKVTGSNVFGNLWNISTASYSQGYNTSAQDGTPLGLFFKTDGDKFYISGAADAIYEYNMSTAWDISTASYVQSFSVAAQESNPQDVFFKPDGTKMYMVGSSGRDVNEYDLSTAWDISTASYVQSFSVAAQEGFPQGVFFKPDGTKMYIGGSSGDEVNEYNLSTAWDISTASYLQNFSVAAQDISPENLFFRSDGTKMYVIGGANGSVLEYDLSTAWDISTASYLQNFSVATQESFPQGISFKSDGSKMYILGFGNDTVYEYDIGSVTTATFTYPASVKWPSGTAPTAPSNGETDLLTFLTIDGGTTYYGVQSGDNFS